MVTPETLTDEQIIIERGNSACDASQANRIHWLCELALGCPADQSEIASWRQRICDAINARAKDGAR